MDGSGSLQYLIFQLLPNSPSNKQRDKHLQDALVADLRSAFVLIAELQKTATELKLQVKVLNASLPAPCNFLVT